MRPQCSTFFPFTTLFRSPPSPARCSCSTSPRSACTPPTSPRSSARCASSPLAPRSGDRKSTRLNSSHVENSYAVVSLKKKKKILQESISYINPDLQKPSFLCELVQVYA